MSKWTCPLPGGEYTMEGASKCEAQPCFCAVAAVMGCTCGLYQNEVRRMTGHHHRECGAAYQEKS